MNHENEHLSDDTEAAADGAEKEVETSDVGVSAHTDAEGSAESPEEKLERISREHDVPIEIDPKDAQAEAEASSDDASDHRGEGTTDDDDSETEPPD